MPLGHKVFGYGVLLALLASPVGAATSPPPLDGHAIAERDCGECHAVGARGNSAMPKAPAFRRLGERYDVEDLAESLAEGISAGHPMTPIAAYSPEEVAQMVAYLKALQPARPAQRQRP